MVVEPHPHFTLNQIKNRPSVPISITSISRELDWLLVTMKKPTRLSGATPKL